MPVPAGNADYRARRVKKKLLDSMFGGTLPTNPMAIPDGFVCVVYGPSGSVQANGKFKSGVPDLSIDFSSYGADSSFPFDSFFFGYVYATGAGTIKYVFLTRELAQSVRFDTSNPVLTSSLTTLNSMLSQLSSILTQLQSTLQVDNTVLSNGGGTLAVQVTSGVSVPTGTSTKTAQYNPPGGKKLRFWGVLGVWVPGSLTAPVTITDLKCVIQKNTAGYGYALGPTWEASSLSDNALNSDALAVQPPSFTGVFTGASVSHTVKSDAGMVYEIESDCSLLFQIAFNNTSGVAGNGTMLLMVIGELVPL